MGGGQLQPISLDRTEVMVLNYPNPIAGILRTVSSTGDSVLRRCSLVRNRVMWTRVSSEDSVR